MSVPKLFVLTRNGVPISAYYSAENAKMDYNKHLSQFPEVVWEITQVPVLKYKIAKDTKPADLP